MPNEELGPEEEDHTSTRLPSLPTKIWKKMSEAQRAAWLKEVELYKEYLREEHRKKKAKKMGY